MGAALKAIALAILVAACSPPPPAFDREQEEFAVRALIAKNPADQIDADHARMRIVSKVDINEAGDLAHVEGHYVEAPKAGRQGVQTPGGRFVTEARKAGGVWRIASDKVSPTGRSLVDAPPSAAP